MTVYIRPNGDDENDGSENAPVKSPKRAIAIANRNKDQEINLLTTDWARINRELGAEEAVPTAGLITLGGGTRLGPSTCWLEPGVMH